jgi:hypothetical protein
MKEKSQDLIFDFTDLYKDFTDNQGFKKDVLGDDVRYCHEKARDAKQGRDVLVFNRHKGIYGNNRNIGF